MPRKPFEPKPWGVGAVVEYEGRQGVVWSPGPAPASAWVLEEPDGRPVAVKLPTRSREARVLTDWRYLRPEARLARSERIRAAVVLAHEVPYVSRSFRGMFNQTSYTRYTAHASTDCPEAVGDVVQGYPLGRVALRELLGEPHVGDQAKPLFCGCLALYPA